MAFFFVLLRPYTTHKAIQVMKTLLSWLALNPTKHKVKTEMVAGLTTFLTMSYILAVNPIILSERGMDKGAVFVMT